MVCSNWSWVSPAYDLNKLLIQLNQLDLGIVQTSYQMMTREYPPHAVTTSQEETLVVLGFDTLRLLS